MEHSALDNYEKHELPGRFYKENKEAFSRLFLNYYPGMRLFAEGYVGEAYAEDIANDVFLRLYQSGQTFQDASHLKAYLYLAVKHACYDLLKTTAHAGERQRVFLNEREGCEPAYLCHIMQTEAVRTLHQALSYLPEQTAEVIRLTYLDGLSNQEAADELGISINTIKTHKQRGLHKLRQMLPKDQFTTLLTLFF